MVSVTKYAGYKKQKRLDVTAGIDWRSSASSKTMMTQTCAHSLAVSLHERSRFGCYMSHVSLCKIPPDGSTIRGRSEDDTVIMITFLMN